MSKSAFFDVDYTLYHGYSASNLSRFLATKGYVGKEIMDGELALERDYKGGVIDYREASRWALQLNADAIKGKTLDEVDAWLREFILEHNAIYPWAAELIALLRSRGYAIYLISGSLELTIKPIADILGVEDYYGSRVAMDKGIYTGELELMLNFEEKHNLVRQLLAETKHQKRVGFGDSAGDIDMLEAMEVAVMYDPSSPDVAKSARERGWFIAKSDTILDFAWANL